MTFIHRAGREEKKVLRETNLPRMKKSCGDGRNAKGGRLEELGAASVISAHRRPTLDGRFHVDLGQRQ